MENLEVITMDTAELDGSSAALPELRESSGSAGSAGSFVSVGDEPASVPLSPAADGGAAVDASLEVQGVVGGSE